MTDKEWVDVITETMKSSNRDYCYGWWLCTKVNMTTRKINNKLKVLVKEGILSSVTTNYGVIYRIIDTTLINY